MSSRVPIAAIIGLSLTISTSALGQDSRKTKQEQVNSNTVFIAGGSVGATYHALANDIALVTSGDGLRVVSVTTTSAVQNVRDLVYLRSIDVAFTNPRVLKGFVASGELGPDLDRRIRYIAPLTTEEAHILARPEINSINDLKGKRVSFHLAGSSSAMAGALIFRTLGINVQTFNLPQPEAIEKMGRKEIDATICFCPKSLPAYASLPAHAGFKFIEVPYPSAFEADFLPSKITSEDYPNLVAKGETVRTIGMYTILITLNWPKGSMRYDRNARFVEALFSRFADFLKPPRQRSWKNVNFSAKVPAWQRFAPAQEWIDGPGQEMAKERTNFDRFLNERAKRPEALSAADREWLFREYQNWSRKKQ